MKKKRITNNGRQILSSETQDRMEMLLIRLFNCRNNDNLEVIIKALGKVKKFFNDKVYNKVFEQVLEIMRDNGDFSDNFESVLNYIYQYALDFATEELCGGAYINWEEELEYHKSICFDLEYEFEESDFDFLELDFEIDPKKVKEIIKKFNDFMRG